MPFVILLLVIIVCLLYPPLFTVLLLLVAIFFLISLGPIIIVIVGIASIFVATWFFGLEGDVIESLESRGGRASVAEVLIDSGISVSDRSGCVFATCRVYGKLDDLLHDGDLIVLGSEQRILRSDQLLLLRQE